MKAFLTGGTGFVGSHLAEELMRRGYNVTAMVRSDPKWLAALDVAHAPCDLRSMETLCSALKESDYVFHVAGMTRAPRPEQLVMANVEGTATLLEAVREAAPNVRRVVITSSQAAAGPSPIVGGAPVAVTEEEPLRPITAYGESKAQMERMITERFSDLPVVIVRPPSVYGPREADIYTVIKTAARLRLFPVVGDPRLPRISLVHVRDLVRGIVDAAEADGTIGQAYYVSSDRGYSWGEIGAAVSTALGSRLLTLRVPAGLVPPMGAVVETVAGLFGRYPPLNREKAREATGAWICSSEKAGRDFGYRQTVPLSEGMAETIAWYRQEGWL